MSSAHQVSRLEECLFKEPNMTSFAISNAPRPVLVHSSLVAELMTQKPLAFEKTMPIQKAFALLQFNKLDAAPVVDEHHRLAGVVTSASCHAWEEFTLRSSSDSLIPRHLDVTPVWEISNPNVESIHQDAPASDVIDRLVEGRARRMYVVDSDHALVGVVSIADVVRHFIESADDSAVLKKSA
jgi:CBS-domain-containing membrane protein